jgi:hypothetical protein
LLIFANPDNASRAQSIQFQQGMLMQFTSTQAEIETRMSRYRNGAVMATCGWIILGFAFVLALFWYNSVKDGDLFWRALTGSTAVIGVVLIGVGNHFRRFA